MKGTQFHEVAAAAIPVFLLAAMVEQRRVAERLEIWNWQNLILLIGWAVQLTLFGAVEVSCLLQLAYQPAEVNWFADPNVVVGTVISALIFLSLQVILDVVDPSRYRKTVSELREPLVDRARLLSESRTRLERIESRAIEFRRLDVLPEINEIRETLAVEEERLAKLQDRVDRVLRFWPHWAYGLVTFGKKKSR